MTRDDFIDILATELMMSDGDAPIVERRHRAMALKVLGVLYREGIPVVSLLDGAVVTVPRHDLPYIEFGKRSADILAAKVPAICLPLDGTIAGATPITNPPEEETDEQT